MKKIKLCIMITVLLLVLAACDNSNDNETRILSEITIESLPNQTSYYVNEIFKKEGLTIRANFTDGTYEILDVVGSMIHPVSTEDSGEKTIIVNYLVNGVIKTTTFTITVLEDSIEELVIMSQPSKTSYVEGDSFESLGLTVKAVYHSGAESMVTNYNISKTILDKSDTSIRISVGEVYVDIMITVEALEDFSSYPFIPGELGDFSHFTHYENVDGFFSGFYVERVVRSNNIYGSGTYNRVELKFPEPWEVDTEMFYLEYQDTNEEWHRFMKNDEELTSTYNNFSLNLSEIYTFRLVASGGDNDGAISNTVTTDLSTMDTYFSTWGLDESMFLTGIMVPYVGRGLEAYATVKSLGTGEEIEDAITYSWYRIHPVTFERMLIENEDGAIYITDDDDIGYHIMVRIEGDHVKASGFVEIISYWGVMAPVEGYLTDVDETSFVLRLSHDYEELMDDLLTIITFDTYEELTVLSITKVGVASFLIEYSNWTQDEGITLYYEDNFIVFVATEEFGHSMPGIDYEIIKAAE